MYLVGEIVKWCPNGKAYAIVSGRKIQYHTVSVSGNLVFFSPKGKKSLIFRALCLVQIAHFLAAPCRLFYCIVIISTRPTLPPRKEEAVSVTFQDGKLGGKNESLRKVFSACCRQLSKKKKTFITKHAITSGTIFDYFPYHAF